MTTPTALVTGATGFVGSHLVHHLRQTGWRVRAALRTPGPGNWDEACIIGDLAARPDWRAAVAGVDCVFHLAARVHVMKERATDSEAAFQAANVEATRLLRDACIGAGVRRLCYLSSAKVLGDSSQPGRPLQEDDIPQPGDAYARSKRDAEALLGAAHGLETVVLRPPLVYGAGVGANFLRMMKWSRSGIWLPFGAVENRRSLVYVGNLVDALAAVACDPAASGIFHVCDRESVSTTRLLSTLSRVAGRKPRLIPVPTALLQAGMALVGKRAEAARLLGSLELDATKLHRDLGWRPPFSLEQGLRATLERYAAVASPQ